MSAFLKPPPPGLYDDLLKPPTKPTWRETRPTKTPGGSLFSDPALLFGTLYSGGYVTIIRGECFAVLCLPGRGALLPFPATPEGVHDAMTWVEHQVWGED